MANVGNLMKRHISRFSLILFALAVIAPSCLKPARAISLIRDAEIENTIRMYGAPLFGMAGLDVRSVRVFIVNDPGLNAFVAGGQNIFLNSGLLMRAETANQVIGVIAHETGHITGGHLSRMHDQLARANWQSILAMVLGTAVIAAGGADAGAAIVSAGQQVAQRGFLQYSRTQEAAADQAAFRMLDATGQSSRGMMEFFQILGAQEALITANQDPYVRTHPMSSDRIATARNHIRSSPHSNKSDSPELQLVHARMRAKLKGFLNPPEQTLRDYPAEDVSLPAIYARAIAHHKANNMTDSLREMDRLLAKHPDDAYFHELRGQILLEHGKVAEAPSSYRRAAELKPDAPQILVGLGRSLLADESATTAVGEATKVLRRAARLNPQLASAWRWLAVAYGRQGDIGNASLATAERYLLNGRLRDAIDQAKRAEHHLAVGSSGHLRAQDIISAARYHLRQQEKNRRR